ncbi:MAG TPA: hypothetical protein VF881_06795 [Polyangiaceae bacterium]
MKDPARRPVHVTIVSANEETLDGLQTYLQQAGLDARGTRQLEGGRTAESPQGAVVFFPDEFVRENVLREVRRLRRDQPRVLVVLVTSEPHRFVEALDIDDKPPHPVIVPKPVWGWIILDAIRGI